MLEKRKRELIESASNAVSGYVAIVLAIVCFILVLMVTIALTRLFVGLSLSSNPSLSVQGNPQVTVAQVSTTTAPLT